MNSTELNNQLNKGLNCAQVVASAYAEKLNLDEKTILAATSGFGGGMGRQAMTCGALTGAVLILGIANNQKGEFTPESKELNYQKVRTLFSQFSEIHGADTCKNLLGCDISTPEGFDIHKTGCHREKCVGFMKTSMEILNTMI